MDKRPQDRVIHRPRHHHGDNHTQPAASDPAFRVLVSHVKYPSTVVYSRCSAASFCAGLFRRPCIACIGKRQTRLTHPGRNAASYGTSAANSTSWRFLHSPAANARARFRRSARGTNPPIFECADVDPFLPITNPGYEAKFATNNRRRATWRDSFTPAGFSTTAVSVCLFMILTLRLLRGGPVPAHRLKISRLACRDRVAFRPYSVIGFHLTQHLTYPLPC